MDALAWPTGVAEAAKRELLAVDSEGWLGEIESIREHYARLGDRLPVALHEQLEQMEQQLRVSSPS